MDAHTHTLRLSFLIQEALGGQWPAFFSLLLRAGGRFGGPAEGLSKKAENAYSQFLPLDSAKLRLKFMNMIFGNFRGPLESLGGLF